METFTIIILIVSLILSTTKNNNTYCEITNEKQGIINETKQQFQKQNIKEREKKNVQKTK